MKSTFGLVTPLAFSRQQHALIETPVKTYHLAEEFCSLWQGRHSFSGTLGVTISFLCFPSQNFWTDRGRMKRTLLAGVAMAASLTGPVTAADLAVRAPAYKAPPPVVAVYSWTGFYFGGNVGGVWAKDDVTWNASTAGFGAGAFTAALNATGTGRIDGAGVTAGGQIGFNHQINSVVVWGVEADLNYTDLSDSRSLAVASPPATPGTTVTSTYESKWLATVRGRIGFLPTQNSPPLCHRWCRVCRHQDQRFRFLHIRRLEQCSVQRQDQDRLDGRRRSGMGLERRLERQGRVPLCRSRQHQLHKFEQLAGQPARDHQPRPSHRREYRPYRPQLSFRRRSGRRQVLIPRRHLDTKSPGHPRAFLRSGARFGAMAALPRGVTG